MHISDNLYTQGFHIQDGFLSKEHYTAIREVLESLHQEGSFRPAKIGKNLNKKHNETIRGDHIYWLDQEEATPPINGYFSKIDELRELLNQTLFLGLVDVEAHFAIYQPNQFYKKHVDQFLTQQDRRISCVYYLNEDWQEQDGGELRLYDTNDRLLQTILPQGNRLVSFNSNLPHEVCTAYRTRYSIAAWLKIRKINLVA